MSETKNSGPAFPTVKRANGRLIRLDGMTLRDYFAAKALPSVIHKCSSDSRGGMTFEEYFASKAYAIADAMLKAREA